MDVLCSAKIDKKKRGKEKKKLKAFPLSQKYVNVERKIMKKIKTKSITLRKTAGLV